MKVGGPAPTRARSSSSSCGEVADDVVRVDVGTVALGRPGGLRDDVDADDRRHAEALELLADEAVAGADVERRERGGIHAGLLELLLEQPDHDLGRAALQVVVEDPLVEPRDVVDLVVVVEADRVRLAVGTTSHHSVSCDAAASSSEGKRTVSSVMVSLKVLLTVGSLFSCPR